MRAAVWEAEHHLLRGEWYAAARPLERLAPGEAGDLDELVQGLHHLAAAGFKASCGERERARRQVAHARRRLGEFLPEAEQVDLAALLNLVEAAVEQG